MTERPPAEACAALTPESLKGLGDRAARALEAVRSARASREFQEKRLREAIEVEEEARAAWDEASSALKAAVDGVLVEEVMSS